MKISDCVALVTGGASGIGQEICKALLKHGAKVHCVNFRQFYRVVTRYVGSGIKRVGSRIRRMGSKITALGSGISDHGIGISSFLGIRDQAATYLWDQRRKWVTLLGSRIRNLRTKMGTAKKKHTSLPVWF